MIKKSVKSRSNSVALRFMNLPKAFLSRPNAANSTKIGRNVKNEVNYFLFLAEEEEFNEDLDSPVPAPASKSEPEQSVAQQH